MSGVFLKRIEWNSVDDITNPVVGLSPMNDVKAITARKGTDVKNNIMTVTLKNPDSKYVGSGVIRFQEEDSLKLYLKLTDDAADIGGTWYDSSNFVGAYFLEEYQHTSTLNKHEIKLTCVDRAYILFNKVFTKTYGVASNDYWTSPGIMRNVARLNTFTENTNEFIGTDNDAGVYFNTESKFVSQGGNITDFRADTNTQLDGALTDSATTITVDSTAGFKSTSGTLVIGSEHIYYTTATSTTFTGCVRAIDDTVAAAALDNATVYQGFPIVDITKVWKPLYEWLQELGTTQFTNYEDETATGSALKYSRAFLLWVDKDNSINWYPADQTVDITLTVGSDEIYELSLEKSVFDSVNMVIYNIGEDMYGVGAIWYYFNENSEVSTLKMRYQPMTELIDTILNKEYELNSGDFPSASVGDSNRRFPTSYNYVPNFLPDTNRWLVEVENEPPITEVSTDNEFNEALRKAAFYRGRAEAKMITSLLSGLRYRGTVTLRGTHINPGDLISVTDSYTGLETQKLRVIDVSQNVSPTQWSTTLTVEEDEQTIQT